ncbi:MAG: DUF2272 domain-containing protein [Acidisphaera sp.]|nr:DUF2272 domain-containing protein [Acidisphaera sp.]
MIFRPICAAALTFLLAGCAGHRVIRPGRGLVPRPTAAPFDPRVPDFAAKPYQPFSREDAVAIAMREWRLFGEPVDDDPPGLRPVPPPELKPEREPGLWQRVGEYWFIGQDPELREGAWTGMHDEYGNLFPADQDDRYAWSAAFISYVMRIDGAGARFPYSPNHAAYIDVAADMALGRTSGYVVTAERPSAYAPQLGDLICFARGRSAGLRFDDLPAPAFPAHCAIVVQVTPGQLAVIGGNVDDAVTLTHVPVTEQGTLAGPDGGVLDTRYPWMVVLRVLYDR